MSASASPRTDAQVADDIRRKLSEALEPALSILREANEQGFNVGFNVGGDPVAVTKIDVAKRL